MDDQINKRYRDRLRILIIIYSFSNPFCELEHPDRVGLLKSEVKLQKLDFMIRYPSYLCFELMAKMREDSTIDRATIREIVRDIFRSKEPELRTIEMKKFLFGAWENLDRTISFLAAHGLIHFESKIGSTFKQYQKEYYLTKLGKEKIEAALLELPSVSWYCQRCELIKRYFGDLTGTDLKAIQYGHETYKDALINTYISDISQQAKQLFKSEFEEAI